MFSTAKIETFFDTSKYAGYTTKKADRKLTRQTNDYKKGRMANLKTSAAWARRYGIRALWQGSGRASADNRLNCPELR